MSTLNEYLHGLYNVEKTKTASVNLDAEMMRLSPDELLKIATTGNMVRKAQTARPVREKRAGIQTRGHNSTIQKEASAKLAWADQWGRMLAAMEMESKIEKRAYDIGSTGKSACMGVKTSDFEKQEDFTTPEAQEKAKVVQQALKSTKGAPAHIRKAAVKVTAEKLKQASLKYAGPDFIDRQMQADQAAAESQGLQGGVGGALGGLGGAALGHHLGGVGGAIGGGLLGAGVGVGAGLLGSHLAKRRREALQAMDTGGEKNLDWLQRAHVASQSAEENPYLRAGLGAAVGGLAGHGFRPGLGTAIGAVGGAGLGLLGSHLSRKHRSAITQM